MLDCLRTLLAEKGRLSRALIDDSKIGPTASAYQVHFGGLLAAYKLIGYNPPARRLGIKGRNGRFIEAPLSTGSRTLALAAIWARKMRAKKRALKH